MKQRTFIVLFIAINIIFIVLHIHKQSLMVKLSYEKQRLEHERQQLISKKDSLVHQWHELHKPSAIKEYAQKELGMRKPSLNQLKKLYANE